MVPRTPKSVVVIGAGLAGAAAARQLAKWGFRVVVLEGRNRSGGRVWSTRMEGGGRMGVAELGGQIITGIDGNPLAVLAHQLGLSMHEIKNRCPLYLDDGTEAPADLDQLVRVSGCGSVYEYWVGVVRHVWVGTTGVQVALPLFCQLNTAGCPYAICSLMHG